MNPDETSLDPALLASLRPGRQPVTGHDDPAGDLRVFAIQYRIDLAHAESIDSYRAAMRALMDELVVPHMVPGRPTLVVYPEAVGLPVLAIGERGAAIRALGFGPGAAPGADGLPVALLSGMQALAEASMDRIGAYAGMFGADAIDPRTAVHLAGTDTAARAFSQTFSDIASDYGAWVVAGNYQTPYRETIDPAEVAAFGIPDDIVAYVATTPAVTNATFLWGPEEVAPGAPAGERNLLFRNEKVPLTEMELGLLGLAEGPVEGDEGRANAGWADVAGFRVGFATSLPAFAYGYPFGERPEGFDPLADVRESYAAAQDALGVDVMIQADANPGPWAAYTDPAQGGTGAWQPLEWMGSTWRAVADPTVSFAYNVTPMMTGNLLDLMFDGQSSITARGGAAAPSRFVGNAASGPGDPSEYDVYAGDKPEFLAVSPWVTPDADRDSLMGITWALSPGSGTALENGYVETAIYADLRRPEPRFVIDGRSSAWGFPIIDMHCHFPVPDLPDPVIEAHRAEFGDAKADKVAADSRWYQEQWWTARGFAFPEEVEPPAQIQADRWDAEISASALDAVVFMTGGGNDTLAAAIAGRERMYGFAHHDPFAPDAVSELRRAVTELGFIGYKVIAPALTGPIDDPALRPVWDAVEELGIPVLVHFGPNGGGGGTAWHENINPLRLHSVAKGYPDVPFIVPHFGCGWPRELLHLMWACRNVHVDTSGNNEWIRWMPDRFTLADYFRKFHETVGPSRILFGSDSAWFPRGLARAYFDEQVRIVRELGWSDADRDLVFHGNAARLLRLEPGA